MSHLPILLKDITFEDRSSGALKNDPLRYPIYGNLIDPDVVAVHHGSMQLEPAFQFHPESRSNPSGEPFRFVFELAQDGNVFFACEAGRPIYREVTGAPMDCVKDVFFEESSGELKTCVVEVDPTHWGSSPPNVTLRIFCNYDKGSNQYIQGHGVSLSLIQKPADQRAAARTGPIPSPLLDRKLAITAKIPTLHEPGKFPQYSIFQDLELPAGISLEPALRFSQHRPSANLSIRLESSQPLRFKAAGTESLDDVELLLGSHDGKLPPGSPPELPPELSAVKSDLLAADPDRLGSARFTWQRGSGAPRVCGFSLAIVYRTDGQNTWQMYERGIDPILFNDPPPIGEAEDGLS